MSSEAREKWSSSLEFFSASLGCAVGFGCFWRFPYLAFENGGITFFIPYLLILCFAGVPLFYMELAVGQTTQSVNPHFILLHHFRPDY